MTGKFGAWFDLLILGLIFIVNMLLCHLYLLWREIAVESCHCPAFWQVHETLPMRSAVQKPSVGAGDQTCTKKPITSPLFLPPLKVENCGAKANIM
jgi:hypothetical protein